MAIQPQFTAFNPYQLQAEQEAVQRMLQQQEAEQRQQQQAYANWVQGQQQQQLQPQPQIQIQPTGFGYDQYFLILYSDSLIMYICVHF
jgi:epsin